MQEKSFADLVACLGNLLAPSLAVDWPNLPVSHASGTCVWGTDGRRYLDFVSGMATANLGHNHPRVVAAAKEQMEKLIHGPVGVLLYEPILRLADELRAVMPGDLDMFFFGNSGAEAVEGAVKLARYVTGRPALIAFEGGFHGRTMGAASVTSSKSKYRLHYEPMLPGVYFAPYPYCYRCPAGRQQGACSLECLERLEGMFQHLVDPSQVAAILIEPVLGEGGYVVPPPGYLRGLRELCDRHGILLIFDEVQTGFGRTGAMFAAQAVGVNPDIMAVAKGIASGFPLGATVAPSRLMKKWSPGAHGTTFGGNPVACAAALATLAVMREEDLPGRARRLGDRALARLRDLAARHPQIGDVRGMGLMIGVEFVQPGTGRPDGELVTRVLKECLERGLILYPCGTFNHVIRFIPPLTVSEEDLDTGLDTLAAAVAAATARA
ncbi:MAG: aspartate aminotransferase family protein [Bacillota bacterium]